jgi:hypothetical protein
MSVLEPIFSTWTPIYRELGYWTRPVWHNTKECHVPRWSRPDPEIPEKELQSWLRDYGNFGIAILNGSPLPDGTTLGTLDIDHDAYIPILKTVMRNPPCGRIGSKGIAYFVRVRGSLGNRKYKVKGDAGAPYGQVLECLFEKSICVIPPTIHPKTGEPYRWIGTPLHEVKFSDLPVIGE